MDKSDLVEMVASRTNSAQQTVLDVIDSTLAVMQDALTDGQEIMIPGFGRFSVVNRPERTGTNPKTGDAMVIPATRFARFTSHAALRAAVRSVAQPDSEPAAHPPTLPPESINETDTEAHAMAKKKDKKKDKKKKDKKKKKK